MERISQQLRNSFQVGGTPGAEDGRHALSIDQVIAATIIGLDTLERFTFHHLGVAVPSIEKALPAYQDLFGYRLVSGPFRDPIQRVSVCFLEQPGAANFTIELVEPLDETSPVRKLLEKGGGAYH